MFYRKLSTACGSKLWDDMNISIVTPTIIVVIVVVVVLVVGSILYFCCHSDLFFYWGYDRLLSLLICSCVLLHTSDNTFVLEQGVEE